MCEPDMWNLYSEKKANVVRIYTYTVYYTYTSIEPYYTGVI